MVGMINIKKAGMVKTISVVRCNGTPDDSGDRYFCVASGRALPQKCMPKEFIWGPVRGKTPWRGTASFPLPPHQKKGRPFRTARHVANAGDRYCT